MILFFIKIEEKFKDFLTLMMRNVMVEVTQGKYFHLIYFYSLETFMEFKIFYGIISKIPINKMFLL